MKNLVIIGGGFAGATLAKKVQCRLPPEWNIYLLSETNFVTYYPLLPEVVGASVLPGHIQAPLRQIARHARIRMVKVDNIDFEQKKVFYHNNEAGELPFDQLVFAAGVRANTNMMPGMQEYALPLKTVGDALYIRNQMIDRMEQATIHPEPYHRKHLTTFIVIGGGFSGVETAGELDDFLKAAVHYYKNVRLEDCRVILLHSGDRLLPEISEKLGRKTEREFKKRHIEVRLNTRALRIEADRVILDNGEAITAGTIICTIGTLPHGFIQNDALPRERGKIKTQGDMSVTGMNGIWALGDCALVPNARDGKFCPATAQFADRQARFLAKNIAASVRGKTTRNFSFRPIGLMASTGHNKAVAEIYCFRISGLVGFLLWRAAYLIKVPTLARKVRLYLEWTWAMFFPPDIAHLGFKRTEPDATASNIEVDNH
ncbi:MAG: NAD(P)/FAD-dependent oxidoreductase [Gammaproteobacteria bacterium HGW-Gammaproteobacteria-3]|nr:MAG: NAD(P)/FAD-dependent oxidoreductase [Gammaproteobacteria bacterium HGW-Gammaproteobacteria-3]